MVINKKILGTVLIGFLTASSASVSYGQTTKKPTIPSSIGKIQKKPQIPTIGLKACKRNAARKSVQISVKKLRSAQLVMGAKIALMYNSSDAGPVSIAREKQTFGGKLKINNLCPGRYIAYAYGTENGGVIINSGGTRYLQDQRAFTIGNQSENVDIFVEPVMPKKKKK